MLEEGAPFIFGPVFLVAAASGVEGDARGEMTGQAGGGWAANLWDGIGVKNCESLEWREESFGGVEIGIFVGAMGACDELGAGGACDIGLEDFIRIVKIGQDEVETPEVGGEIGIQIAVAGEETGQGPGFDGSQLVDPFRGELSDVRIAEQGQVSLGKLLAEGGDGGQGEDEIADGAAADDQNAALGASGFSVGGRSRLGGAGHSRSEGGWLELGEAQEDQEKGEAEPKGTPEPDALFGGGGPI